MLYLLFLHEFMRFKCHSALFQGMVPFFFSNEILCYFKGLKPHNAGRFRMK